MPTNTGYPFKRIYVDHVTLGQTRIWWEFDEAFQDTGAFTYQLQFGHAGTPGAVDWEDVGEIAEDASYLVDDEQRETGRVLHGHYRIILTTAHAKYASQPVAYLGLLTTNDWVQAREIIRKEQLRHTLVSPDGYLLKRMRYGERCSKCLDWDTEECTNSDCDECMGTSFKVGYHAPVPYQCFDRGLETIAERQNLEGTGTTRDKAAISARALGLPILAKYDVYVDRATDRRYFIHTIEQKAAIRGVPLICDIELRLAPHTDPVYRIEVGGEPAARPGPVLPDAGSGSETVDHDFGGTDELVYTTAGGIPILGATILAFSATDYSADLTAEEALAASYTAANGRWAFALKLDPGDYILRFEKVGEYGPDVQAITVPE